MENKTMKYKVGDRVAVKSRKWYDENKDEYGIIQIGTDTFVRSMSKFCGGTVTISQLKNKSYLIEGDPDKFHWYDDMFEDSSKTNKEDNNG